MTHKDEQAQARLHQVAQKFCQQSTGLALADWPRNAIGLRKLAATLDDACDALDAGERNEEEIIEGGGALLAWILLDALSARARWEADRLLLRVGPYGYFDPFEALRHVVDSDSPSESLRAEVARAEAEASNDGPHARVVAELVEQVHTSTSHRFERCDFASVEFSGSLEISLTSLLRVCAGEPKEDVRAAVSRVVHAIPSHSHGVPSWETVRERVFPRVVARSFVEQMAARGLCFEPFTNDLWLSFVVRDGKMVRFLRETELTGRPRTEVRQLSVTNLEAISSRVRVRPYCDDPRAAGQSHPDVLQLTYGDGFDASRIVLPALQASLQERIGDNSLLSAPHRDALLVAPRSAWASLREATQSAYGRAPHALSLQLFEFSDAGLRAAEMPE